MGEQQGHTPETELSPEQARLVASVRTLLTSPSTQIDEYIELRPTTRREKAAFVLGRLIGRHRRSDESQTIPTRSFSETPKARHTLRAKWVDWGAPSDTEGNWYVSGELTTNIDTDATAEQLVMYRAVMDTADWGSPDGSDKRPYILEIYDLLSPIDNPDHITRMQARVYAALVWERYRQRPDS